MFRTSALILATALVVSGCAIPSAEGEPAPRQGTITRDGTTLLLDGAPWKFAGLNADTWFGCWEGEQEATTEANLDRYFGELNPNSVTRIWPYPGYDPALMDLIVRKAEEHSQYLAPTLVNGNSDCSSIDPPSYTPGTNAEELAHVDDIVTRYKDTPAIAFWEIVNEPDGENPDLKGFYQEMSDAIKAIDPDTLVGSGSHAAWSGGEEKYLDDHDAPNVDLISMHEYDADTGLSPWAAASDRAATALDKPWYAGEDGFCCGGGSAGEEGNADKLRAEWDAYLGSPNCAGMLYWDFKWGYAEDVDNVTLDDPMWTVASTYAPPGAR